MHLDFITFSLPYNERFHVGLPKHDAFIFNEKNPVRPLPRYKQAWRLSCGGIYCVPDAEHASQKRIIQMTGRDCQKAREMGLDDDLLLHLAQNEHATMTRIDCAFDTQEKTAKVQDFITAYESGKMKTKVRTMEVTKKIGRKGEPANSAYLGTRQSDAQLVVYDKAKQLKLLQTVWIRVEYRAYKNSAWRLAKDALEHGIDLVARQRIRTMQRSKIKWLNSMIDGEDIDLTMREQQENFWWWAENQVRGGFDNRSASYPHERDQLREYLQERLAVIDRHENMAELDMDESED